MVIPPFLVAFKACLWLSSNPDSLFSLFLAWFKLNLALGSLGMLPTLYFTPYYVLLSGFGCEKKNELEPQFIEVGLNWLSSSFAHLIWEADHGIHSSSWCDFTFVSFIYLLLV